MERDCKRILNAMIAQGQGTECFCHYLSSECPEARFTVWDLSAMLDMRVADLQAAVLQLELDGYISCCRSDKVITGFRLTYKGLKWKYYRREANWDYVADKWAEIFAAVIALVSLIVSIIAISQ